MAPPVSMEGAVWQAVVRLAAEGWIDAPTDEDRRRIARLLVDVLRYAESTAAALPASPP